MIKKKPKTTFSVRIDPDHLKLADKKKIDLKPIVQDAVAKAIGVETCPTCGRPVREV